MKCDPLHTGKPFIEYIQQKDTGSLAATDVDFLELLQVVPKASLLAAQNAHRRASAPNLDS
jgi:hypothetical protein